MRVNPSFAVSSEVYATRDLSTGRWVAKVVIRPSISTPWLCAKAKELENLPSFTYLDELLSYMDTNYKNELHTFTDNGITLLANPACLLVPGNGIPESTWFLFAGDGYVTSKRYHLNCQ